MKSVSRRMVAVLLAMMMLFSSAVTGVVASAEVAKSQRNFSIKTELFALDSESGTWKKADKLSVGDTAKLRVSLSNNYPTAGSYLVLAYDKSVLTPQIDEYGQNAVVNSSDFANTNIDYVYIGCSTGLADALYKKGCITQAEYRQYGFISAIILQKASNIFQFDGSDWLFEVDMTVGNAEGSTAQVVMLPLTIMSVTNQNGYVSIPYAVPVQGGYDGDDMYLWYTNMPEMDFQSVPVTNGESTHSHNYQKKTLVAPDCGKQGIDAYVCSCGAVLRYVYTEALSHNFGSFVYDGETAKTHTKVCANNASHTVTEACDFKETATNPATCLTDGSVTYTCKVCGGTYTETLPALNHKYGDFTYDGATAKTHTKVCANDASHTVTVPCTFSSKVTTKATCTQTGVRTYTCSVCGGTYTEEIPMVKHDYKVLATVKATCEYPGSVTYKCANCTASYSEPINALNHDYGDFYYDGAFAKTHTKICSHDAKHTVTESCKFTSKVTKAPTCTEEGERTYTCSVCKGTYTEEIAPLNHDWGDYKYNGAALKTHTRACKNNASHTETENCVFDSKLTTPPTCEDEGEITHTCSVCGGTYTESVDALNHSYGNFVYDGETAKTHTKTCTTDSKHKVTQACDFTDEVTTPPSCSEPGLRTYTCKVCGGTYTEPIAPTDHDYGEYTYNGATAKTHTRVCKNNSGHTDTQNCTFTSKVTTPPTCLTPGVRTYTCSVCGGTYTETIDATDHNYGDFIFDGKTAKTHTKVCTNNPAEHRVTEKCDFTSSVTVSPTCLTPGVRTYTCKVCGGSYTEQIAPTNHDFGDYSYDGETAKTHTRVCKNNSAHKDTQNCSFTSKVTTPPTCLEPGVRTYTCKVCGGTYTEPIAPTDHDYGEYAYNGETVKTHTRVCKNDSAHTDTQNCTFTSKVTTPATCDEPGVRTYTCTVCGGTYTEPVDPLTHNYGNYVYNGATAKTHTRVCKNDPNHKDTQNCTFTNAVTQKPTCSVPGVRTYTCTVCGGTYTEPVSTVPHAMQNEWSSDGMYHWHKCADCDHTEDKAAHVDNNNDGICDICACAYRIYCNATLKIRNNKGSNTVDYRNGIMLTAVTEDMPEDAVIVWYVNGAKAGTGKTFTKTDLREGFFVTVRLENKDGIALKNQQGDEIKDSEQINVNAKFWKKFVAFFKGLFKKLKTIEQALDAVGF